MYPGVCGTRPGTAGYLPAMGTLGYPYPPVDTAIGVLGDPSSPILGNRARSQDGYFMEGVHETADGNRLSRDSLQADSGESATFPMSSSLGIPSFVENRGNRSRRRLLQLPTGVGNPSSSSLGIHGFVQTDAIAVLGNGSSPALWCRTYCCAH